MYIEPTGNAGFGDIASGYQLTATAKVPIEGWSAQDSNFLAALPYDLATTDTTSAQLWNRGDLTIKYSQHTLSADHQGGNGWLTALQFDNLEEGKTYRLTAHAYLVSSVTSKGCSVLVYNGGTAVGDRLQDNLALTIWEEASDGNTSVQKQQELVSFSKIFTPKSKSETIPGDGTLKFYAEVDSSTDVIRGGGRTFMILEELPFHEATSDWG